MKEWLPLERSKRLGEMVVGGWIGRQGNCAATRRGRRSAPSLPTAADDRWQVNERFAKAAVGKILTAVGCARWRAV